MLRKFSSVLLAILFLIPIFLLGYTPLKGLEDEETIRLIVGEARILPTRAPSRIIIGNPAIADVSDVTNSEITLSAKSPGVTTLVYWDAFGEQSLKIRVNQEDMLGLKRRVESMLGKLNLPELYTDIDEDEGKIVLLGKVKSAQEIERISAALGQLKDKTIDLIEVKEEEAVIEIDVQVLELNKDATHTLGLTNPLSSSSGLTLTEVGSQGIATAGAKWSELFKVLNLKHSAFTWTLYALVQEGKARVLSRPRLACQSGKEAELLVGGEKPIITTQVVSGGASGTSVEYKEYGIKLKIKPTVSEQERIKLVLNVEVSEVEDAVTIGGTNTTALAYPLKKRTAATELFLNDGQTMAIGGLMRQKSQEDITKTPGLGDIPIVGMLFRKKVSSIGGGTGEKGDTELFITITPTIVSKKTPEPKSVVSLEKTAPQAVVSLESRNIPPNLENYVRAVQTKIVTAAYYPLSAREAGWEGDVKLNLNLASNGDLKEIKILQSSGYKVLDDAALAVAKKQSPYPPFPPQIESQELWVVVPITYRKN